MNEQEVESNFFAESLFVRPLLCAKEASLKNYVLWQNTEPQIAPKVQASTLRGISLPQVCECKREWAAKAL